MNKELYTYQSSKIIYFTKTPSSYLLIEKKKSISLLKRNVTIETKNKGIK